MAVGGWVVVFVEGYAAFCANNVPWLECEALAIFRNVSENHVAGIRFQIEEGAFGAIDRSYRAGDVKLHVRIADGNGGDNIQKIRQDGYGSEASGKHGSYSTIIRRPAAMVPFGYIAPPVHVF